MTKPKTTDVIEAAELSIKRCGLIMPISASANHSAEHWASVQSLLHRGIKKAGFTPANVWEGVNDRISKRIVTNIFRDDIVVADISDLNPNVMLELGLRLASKKPTIIVFDNISRIPFDIADVEAIRYPSDLNIIDMEIFLDEFSEKISDRYESFEKGTYDPYLGDVVVDVIDPKKKISSADDIILQEIQSINRKISSLEVKTNEISAINSINSNTKSYTFDIQVPIKFSKDFEKQAAMHGTILKKKVTDTHIIFTLISRNNSPASRSFLLNYASTYPET